jgi:hypothetical protein
MRITSGGLVGIGTTSPSYLLDLRTTSTEDAVLAIRNTSTGNAKIYFDAANGDLAGGDYCFIGQNNDLKFYINTDVNAGDIILNPKNGAGNVGIGTTSPSTKLHIYNGSSGYTAYGNTYLIVENSGRAAIQLLAPDSSDQYVFFGSSVQGAQAYVGYEGRSGGDGLMLQSTTGDIFFRAGGTDKMRIKSGGNVGIGTTSPTNKLHVVDTNAMIRVSYSTGGDARYAEFGHGSLIGYAGATNNWFTIGFSGGGTPSSGLPNGGVQISTNGSARMTVAKDGNVGIGTDTPAYALDVTGTIRATGDVIAYSDARVKENVNTITDALTKVTSLIGVSYTRKDTDDKSEKVGVIAQEVLEILPQVVQQDTEGNYSVAYGNIVGVLIEAIKELKAEIDELKNK